MDKILQEVWVETQGTLERIRMSERLYGFMTEMHDGIPPGKFSGTPMEPQKKIGVVKDPSLEGYSFSLDFRIL